MAEADGGGRAQGKFGGRFRVQHGDLYREGTAGTVGQGTDFPRPTF